MLRYIIPRPRWPGGAGVLVHYALGAEAGHLRPVGDHGPTGARGRDPLAPGRPPDRDLIRAQAALAVRPLRDGVRAVRGLGARVLHRAPCPVHLLVQAPLVTGLR